VCHTQRISEKFEPASFFICLIKRPMHFKFSTTLFYQVRAFRFGVVLLLYFLVQLLFEQLNHYMFFWFFHIQGTYSCFPGR